MKKKSLLITLLSVAVGGGVQAQYLHPSIISKAGNNTAASNTTSKTAFISENKTAQNAFAGLQKTTGVVFQTEGFGTGTNTTMPTGWTATGVSPFTATWKWRAQAVTGQYNIGVINSTTASNGWMVYDSDSIGSLFGTTTPIEGYLTSPSYSCTGHSSVQVSFQQWFRKFQDSCFVEVSNNNGTSWTVFPVGANNALGNNTNVLSNPTTTSINISSVAANQASVRIRFHYKCTYAGGSFNWLIDDMTLSELDPVEMDVHRPFVFGGWGEYNSSLNITPLQFVDSVSLVTFSSNNGYTAQTAAPYNVTVYKNGTSANTQSMTKSMPVAATDSIIEYPVLYKPDGVGTYNVVHRVNAASDLVTTNNTDTATFTVTDTLWQNAVGTLAGGYYVHRASSPSTGVTEASFYMGGRFDVPAGKSDTLTAVSAAFTSATTANTRIVAQLYKLDAANNSWSAFATTRVKTLSSSDISTSTALRYAYLQPDVTANSGGIADFVLAEGTYAIVIQGDNVPATSTVVIYATAASLATPYAGYFGQSDSSTNSGTSLYTFGSTLATGMGGAIPVVRAHFANGAAKIVSVPEINKSFVTSVYPNPAANAVTIPVTTTKAGTLNVKIVNTVGQTVATQSFGNVAAGSTTQAKFNTAALPAGIYIYVVDLNGEKTSERFTVAH